MLSARGFPISLLRGADYAKDAQLLFERIGTLLSSNPGLSLKEAARALGTNRHKIECALRESAGTGFRNLKKTVRLKRALALISGERSAKEVAADVGLSPNYLSVFLRPMTGRCLSQLRTENSTQIVDRLTC